MQHVFEFIIKKKEGSLEPLTINLMYVTESTRKNKVGKLIQKELHKKGVCKADEIQEMYLHQLR